MLIFVLSNSCEKKVQDGKLECILDNIKVDLNGMDIEVGQHNGWTDTTALILITYHKKSANIPISGNLKGKYKGNDIYFYQTNVDTVDTHKYKQIPNNIKWRAFVQQKVSDDFIMPPYDPISLQVEYNIKRNCIGDVFKGKGYLLDNAVSKCSCKNR